MAMIPDPRTAPAELTVDTVRAGLLELTEVERRSGARYPRWDARQRAGVSLWGWRSPGERKNGWHLAAVQGNATPSWGQPMWGRVRWEAEAVREDGRSEGMAPLRVPPGRSVIDETGWRKKGRQAAGALAHRVGRPGVGTTGKVGGVWPLPVRGGTPCSPGPALCPRSRRRSVRAAPVRGCPPSARVPRSRPWPSPCGRRPATQGSLPPGGRAPASRAMSGGGWGGGAGTRRCPGRLGARGGLAGLAATTRQDGPCGLAHRRRDTAPCGRGRQRAPGADWS
jgi:hypothetical protein